MTVLSASGLTLSFGDEVIFRDVSFSVNEGDRLGIIGSNGAGKTSLFRVLTGEYDADAGSVFLARDKTVGYLAQNTALTARTDGGRLVRFAGSDDLIGQFAYVEITGNTTWSLTGRLPENCDCHGNQL